LNKYGKQDAVSIPDLEKKLTDLYFSVEDKVQLEKEMAEIHPHKNWLLKTMKPEEKEVQVVEEIKAPVFNETQTCPTCCPTCSMNRKSNFYDEQQKPSTKPTTYEAAIGPLAMLGLLGIFAIALVKIK
jgi:aldehyde:ferredoxin oxidoreductase